MSAQTAPAAAVANAEVVAVACVPAGHAHGAVGEGEDVRACPGGEIRAVVELDFVLQRVQAVAEAAGGVALHGAGVLERQLGHVIGDAGGHGVVGKLRLALEEGRHGGRRLLRRGLGSGRARRLRGGRGGGRRIRLRRRRDGRLLGGGGRFRCEAQRGEDGLGRVRAAQRAAQAQEGLGIVRVAADGFAQLRTQRGRLLRQQQLDEGERDEQRARKAEPGGGQVVVMLLRAHVGIILGGAESYTSFESIS